jgi:hypothetical protein
MCFFTPPSRPKKKQLEKQKEIKYQQQSNSLKTNYEMKLYYEIREMLHDESFVRISKLNELNKELMICTEVGHKSACMGQEILEIRDKIKEFISRSFVLNFTHYDLLRLWREQTYEEGSIPSFSLPPTEQIRLICDNFITFIQKLDVDSIVTLSSRDQIYASFYNYLYKPSPSIEFLEMIDFWISVSGNTILEVLISKISAIEMISEQGSMCLKNDLEYTINVLGNFKLQESLLSHLNSILFSLDFKSIEKIRELQLKNLPDYKEVLKHRAEEIFSIQHIEKQAMGTQDIGKFSY